MTENNKRLEILYIKHNDWLMKCAMNITKDLYTSEELVQNLYLYLGTKGNTNIYYLDSFNLKYCYQFLKTRFINIKLSKKNQLIDNSYCVDELELDILDEIYEYDEDSILSESYDDIKKTIELLKKTNKIWCSAKIFELYFKDENETIESLSKRLNLSKSTVFINIKKIKNYLILNMDNPFQKIKNV